MVEGGSGYREIMLCCALSIQSCHAHVQQALGFEDGMDDKVPMSGVRVHLREVVSGGRRAPCAGEDG